MSETTRRREVTRHRLVEAAIDEFAIRGLDATSVEQLCEAAGFTRGAFYSNFATKDDLCVAIMEYHRDQVLGGHGALGNDMYAPFDACYPADIPQREQDITEAKKLLADAGHSDLTVELITAPAAAGLVESAQVFAQQAEEAGVTVEVKRVDPSEFYGDNYLSWTFAQDFWFTRDYLPQAANSGFPSSPYNETHWDDDEWQDLVNEADATIDEDARCELIKQAQEIEFNEGGYIIWGFPNNLDAYNNTVAGFVPDKSGIPLTSYSFRKVWVEQ